MYNIEGTLWHKALLFKFRNSRTCAKRVIVLRHIMCVCVCVGPCSTLATTVFNWACSKRLEIPVFAYRYDPQQIMYIVDEVYS